METTIRPEEDLFDVANRIYGHPLGVHWLIEDNSIDGITATILPGQVLKIRDARIELIPITAKALQKIKIPEYVLTEYQSIFDLAIEKHGEIEGVFAIVEENGYDGITEYLWDKRAIKVEAPALNNRIKNLLAGFVPVATITEADKSDGIGFMYLETNFLIR